MKCVDNFLTETIKDLGRWGKCYLHTMWLIKVYSDYLNFVFCLYLVSWHQFSSLILGDCLKDILRSISSVSVLIKARQKNLGNLKYIIIKAQSQHMERVPFKFRWASFKWDGFSSTLTLIWVNKRSTFSIYTGDGNVLKTPRILLQIWCW